MTPARYTSRRSSECDKSMRYADPRGGGAAASGDVAGGALNDAGGGGGEDGCGAGERAGGAPHAARSRATAAAAFKRLRNF